MASATGPRRSRTAQPDMVAEITAMSRKTRTQLSVCVAAIAPVQADPRRQRASRHSRSPAPSQQAASVAVSAAARPRDALPRRCPHPFGRKDAAHALITAGTMKTLARKATTIDRASRPPNHAVGLYDEKPRIPYAMVLMIAVVSEARPSWMVAVSIAPSVLAPPPLRAGSD